MGSVIFGALTLAVFYRLLTAEPGRVSGVLAVPATLAHALIDPTVPLIPDRSTPKGN